MQPWQHTCRLGCRCWRAHRLSACRLMPVDAASLMMAMSLSPSMKACFSDMLAICCATPSTRCLYSTLDSPVRTSMPWDNSGVACAWSVGVGSAGGRGSSPAGHAATSESCSTCAPSGLWPHLAPSELCHRSLPAHAVSEVVQRVGRQLQRGREAQQHEAHAQELRRAVAINCGEGGAGRKGMLVLRAKCDRNLVNSSARGVAGGPAGPHAAALRAAHLTAWRCLHARHAAPPAQWPARCAGAPPPVRSRRRRRRPCCRRC